MKMSVQVSHKYALSKKSKQEMVRWLLQDLTNHLLAIVLHKSTVIFGNIVVALVGKNSFVWNTPHVFKLIILHILLKRIDFTVYIDSSEAPALIRLG